MVRPRAIIGTAIIGTAIITIMAADAGTCSVVRYPLAQETTTHRRCASGPRRTNRRAFSHYLLQLGGELAL